MQTDTGRRRQGQTGAELSSAMGEVSLESASLSSAQPPNAGPEHGAGALERLQRQFALDDRRDIAAVFAGGAIAGLIVGAFLHFFIGAAFEDSATSWTLPILVFYFAVPVIAAVSSWHLFTRLRQRYCDYFMHVFDRGCVMQLLIEHETPLDWPRWGGLNRGPTGLWQLLNTDLRRQLDASSFSGRMRLFIRDFRPAMLPAPVEATYPMFPLSTLRSILGATGCLGCLFLPFIPIATVLLISGEVIDCACRAGMRSALLRFFS
ncbi:hypothetical protein IT575_07980 [bacterium]|nr:hypothetical protein [bacterium]